jgi:hypothetical protein
MQVEVVVARRETKLIPPYTPVRSLVGLPTLYLQRNKDRIQATESVLSELRRGHEA